MNLALQIVIVAFLLTEIFAFQSSLLMDEGYSPEFRIDQEMLLKSVLEYGKSGDPEGQMNVLELTKTFIKKPNTIIEYGVVPLLVDYLDAKNSTIQSKSAIFLTHLVKNSPKSIKIMAENGAIPKFIKLMHSSNEKIATPSLISLYDIISTWSNWRKYYDELDAVKQIRKLAERSQSKSVLDNAVGILLVLGESKNPPLKDETAKEWLKTILALVRHSKNEIAKNAALLLPILIHGENIRYQNIYDNEKVIKNLIELLDHHFEQTRTTALVTIGKIINEENEKFMGDSGILKSMPKFLKSSDERVIKLALRIIRQVSMNFNNLISTLLDSNLISSIIGKLNSSTLEIQKDATMLLSFFATNGNDVHLLTMIDNNIIPEFCNLFERNKEADIAQNILVGYYNILHKNKDKRCEIFQQLENCNGLISIQRLETHKNKHVKKMAMNIMNYYHDEGTCSKVDSW